METLKKQTNIRETLKLNRQIFVETLKKQTNMTKQTNIQTKIFVETLKKQTNNRGDVKETDKYSWRR